MSRVLMFTIAALVTALAQTPASADRIRSTTCVGGWHSGSCSTIWRDGTANTHVRRISEPKSELDRAESAQRERLWVARCRPRMTVDQLGVPRYAYFAAGCEFGKYQ